MTVLWVNEVPIKLIEPHMINDAVVGNEVFFDDAVVGTEVLLATQLPR